MAMILRQFCLQTVFWYFLKLHHRLWIELTAQACVAYLADDVVSRVDEHRTISIADREGVVRNDEDLLIPAAWTGFDYI